MAAVIAWSDADAFFGMGRLGGSLSLGESDAWGSRADINVCQTDNGLHRALYTCVSLGCVRWVFGNLKPTQKSGIS